MDTWLDIYCGLEGTGVKAEEWGWLCTVCWGKIGNKTSQVLDSLPFDCWLQLIPQNGLPTFVLEYLFEYQYVNVNIWGHILGQYSLPLKLQYAFSINQLIAWVYKMSGNYERCPEPT